MLLPSLLFFSKVMLNQAQKRKAHNSPIVKDNQSVMTHSRFKSKCSGNGLEIAVLWSVFVVRDEDRR